MLELAQQAGQTPVMMRALAERQRLSPKYLHALLSALKSAGLVTSVRGPGGGFVLARSPDRIKLSEILHALEGPLSLVECVADERACDRASACIARGVWQRLSGAIDAVLDGVTLQDLAKPEADVCSESGEEEAGHNSRKHNGRTAMRTGRSTRAPRTKAGRR
jgi:Rrf2 family protein